MKTSFLQLLEIKIRVEYQFIRTHFYYMYLIADCALELGPTSPMTKSLPWRKKLSLVFYFSLFLTLHNCILPTLDSPGINLSLHTWTMVKWNFISSPNSASLTHSSSSHNHGWMGQTSFSPDDCAFLFVFGRCFLFLLLHHLAEHVSPRVLIWLAV
jgi:hypothetical protein